MRYRVHSRRGGIVQHPPHHGRQSAPFFLRARYIHDAIPEPIEDNFVTPEKSEIRHLDPAGTSRCLRCRCYRCRCYRCRCYQYAQRKRCERSGSKTEHCDSCDSSQREAKPTQTGRCKKNYTDVKKITPAICFSDMSEIRRKMRRVGKQNRSRCFI